MENQAKPTNTFLRLAAVALTGLFAIHALPAQCPKQVLTKFGTGTKGPANNSIQCKDKTGCEPRIGTTWLTTRPGTLNRTWIMHYTTAKEKVPYIVLLGTKRSSIPFLGGTLYVDPTSVLFIVAGEAALTGGFGVYYGHQGEFLPRLTKIPAKLKCGTKAILQGAVFDKAAKNGVALTAGWEFTVGT